jgi:diadenosine tetraphosphatase ApaH/serine/threonine PP2A family protein phosphatase
MKVFDLLPIAALTDNDVLSVHAGLSPYLTLLNDVMWINRRKETPQRGLISDLMWSDPEEGMRLIWTENLRGPGWVFGRLPTERFCSLNGVKLITRSHQLVMEGVKWFFEKDERRGLMIDVWSAPNYMERWGNVGSVLRLRVEGREEFDLATFDAEINRIKEEIPFDPDCYFCLK